MKRLTILTIIFCSTNILFATPSKTMKALWSYCLFNSLEKGPYIETYLNVIGSSVNYSKNKNGKFQSKIELEITFSQGKEIRYHDKYNLLSPETADTNATLFNFIDQQRILLPNGDYDYTLNIRDLERPLLAGEKPFQSVGKIKINFPVDSISLSDIELLDAYTKTTSPSPLSRNGYDLVPLVDNYFGKTTNTLKFYLEAYHTDKATGSGSFLFTAKVYSFDSGVLFEKSSRFQKQEVSPINVLLSELDIKELPSGNYFLEVAVLNRENKSLATQKIFFQRNGTFAKPSAIRDSSGILPFVKAMNNFDTLAENIRCLHPFSEKLERENATRVIASANLLIMQTYFSEFWVKRNPDDPELAWNNYYRDVQEVNRNYKTSIYKGYETERGRVYLQYGKPSSISESKNEPSAYPYEIWHYYKLKNQSNKRFVFYNPDLVTNDYQLLHSDAVGEPYDNQWEIKLNKRNTNTNNFDNGAQPSHFGGKADELYRNPK